MIKTGINGDCNYASSCWQLTHTVLTAYWVDFRALTTSFLQTQIFNVFIQMLTGLLYVPNQIVPWKQNHSLTNMDLFGLHYWAFELLTSHTYVEQASGLASCVHIFLCSYVYACGSQTGVDWKHSPSQHPEGSTVSNGQSLGGSPPSGLCPPGWLLLVARAVGGVTQVELAWSAAN